MDIYFNNNNNIDATSFTDDPYLNPIKEEKEEVETKPKNMDDLITDSNNNRNNNNDDGDDE
ncbi:hypothetical protein Glove_655g5 [Diversispora epigaea]|uniref:Uncharacterized protein n=1 Tax=Diversispora epigaea TaxID=1348612 RepID=A0A397GCE2_9GLOM|nr:hypothetical protein Glove_655g5 [Diversispora epigaea]